MIYLQSRNQDLGTNQVGTLLFFLTRASFSLFGYQLLFKNTGSDSIIAFLLASILSIFLFSFLLRRRRTKKRKKKLSLIARIGILLVSAFFFFFYLAKTIELVQKMMIDTPFLVLAFLFLFLCFLLTKRFLHSLSNSAFLLFFVYLFFFLLLCLGGATLINLDYLKPFLLSPSKTFLESIFFSFLCLLPASIFIIFLPPQEKKHEKKQEKALFSYFILGCLSILLEIILMHLTLGSNLTALYPYPLFALASRISSFLLFDRFFFLFSFYFLFDSTLFLSFLFLLLRTYSKPFLPKHLQKK